ncbi:hypothetical protein [Thermococcus sp.]|uniref:hypothetical protein n=1 Tax=Thermococcus sp. TaxID=35749 RepID=UPI0025E4F9F0|nr:hypothetical protein [Thermococcus sp.]
MKLREFLLHLFVLASATAWELFLAYNSLRLYEYYIKGGTIHLSGVIKCWKEYSPSLTFVILVLLPAIVLIALHIYTKNPALKKSSLSVGIPILLVVLMPLVSDDDTLWLGGMLLTSIVSGIVLGKGKLEKALLVIQGFFPGIHSFHNYRGRTLCLMLNPSRFVLMHRR